MMKNYRHVIIAALLLAPAISIAAPAGHDFSSQFQACYAAADASNEARSSCLADELNAQSKAAADSHAATAQILPGAERQAFTDDFVSWKKTILLDCSLFADKQTVAVERENTRKYCLIEKTLARLNGDDLIRQNKTFGK
ncbi:hypothetical protein LT85_0248 [Collimonas arenae]|uniref:Lysozyme inhibitor LprI N-terminal domain-containing protein n=1 Tax=Collimonas arenae TaxID=279058 RepID=A0A0A1F3W5_9BURK|nr:hypothetical protein [Collimonas arenae]AIY39408.1 hypothetical protein LT85_0248 [Collimonas arenae]